MSTNAALSVRDVSFSYRAKPALDRVSFEIRSGHCTMLLGPNGAGKSTLFSLITRLYDTPTGQIELCGYDIKKQTTQALAYLGIVFQQTTLDLDLLLATCLERGNRLYSRCANRIDLPGKSS